MHHLHCHRLDHQFSSTLRLLTSLITIATLDRQMFVGYGDSFLSGVSANSLRACVLRDLNGPQTDPLDKLSKGAIDWAADFGVLVEVNRGHSSPRYPIGRELKFL